MSKVKRALVGAVGMVVVAVSLAGCDNSISAHYMSAAPGGAVARVWTAPHNGVIDIRGLIQSDAQAGTMKVWITKNDTTIWGPETVSDSSVRADVSSLAVSSGDVVRFVAESALTNGGDPGAKILWDPDVDFE